MFTVLDGLVLKTLPVPDPARLVVIEVQNASGEPGALLRALFDQLVQQRRSLDHVAGFRGGRRRVIVTRRPTRRPI